MAKATLTALGEAGRPPAGAPGQAASPEEAAASSTFCGTPDPRRLGRPAGADGPWTRASTLTVSPPQGRAEQPLHFARVCGDRILKVRSGPWRESWVLGHCGGVTIRGARLRDEELGAFPTPLHLESLPANRPRGPPRPADVSPRDHARRGPHGLVSLRDNPG